MNMKILLFNFGDWYNNQTLNEPNNRNLITVPKVVKPMNMKTFLFNFGD